MPDEPVAPLQQIVAPTQPQDSETWRERAETAERELVLRRALQGIDWFDPEDAFRELSSKMERDAEGKWVVVGGALSPDEVARDPKTGQFTPADRNVCPTTPENAARELAARKPHWVRARVIGGTGAGSGMPGGVSTVTYADLLKPENAAKLKQYIHERPEELARMRKAHFG